jgi:hypothetical protein
MLRVGASFDIRKAMRLAIIAAVIVLPACTPALTGSNARGGSIHMGLGPDKRAKAFNLAEQECGKAGRVARETGHSEWDNSYRYECVDK